MNGILLVSGLIELFFTSSINQLTRVSGTEKIYWIVGMIISISISLLLMIYLAKTIPVGTAYAIWTGIGAVGTLIVGIFFFNEPASAMRIILMLTL